MKQCSTCGAKGLFLELDKRGNCMKCRAALAEQRKREKQNILDEQLKDAKEYHDKLVRIYERLPGDFKYSIPNDTNEIRKIVLVFEELLEALREYDKHERFIEVLVSYLGEADHYGFAQHSVFKCQTYFTSFKDPAISFMNDMIQLINKLHDNYVSVANKTDNFYRMLSETEHASAAINCDAERIRRPLSEFPEIPLMNMTKRTNESTVSDFIVIDLETTGLKPSVNEIIQMCALRFEGGTPVECLLTYVKPTKGINEEARKINGITEDMVNDAPLVEQVMGSFDGFIAGGLPLVGHNILFDLKFLHTNGSKVTSQKRKFYDTCMLAKKVYPDSRHSLDDLCGDVLRIARKDNHSALSDCIATGLLFIELKREIDNN